MSVVRLLQVDHHRLVVELCQLAMFSEPCTPANDGVAVTRIVFSAQDVAARAFVTALATDAGLTTHQDAVGNVFHRWLGSEPSLGAVATGSHIDAIPNAGMYDGTVGVLGGIAAIRALRQAGFAPRRTIEVLQFTSEEPTRFGIGCLGSRLMSGALLVEAAQGLKDKDGRQLDEARTAAGIIGKLNDVPIKSGHYAAFLELHIEQGPLLEQEQLQIGIVSAIAAPASATITVTGRGGHAGANLMPARRDALVAAAEIIQAVEAAALATGAVDTVATVGMCDVFPGAINSVPSRVTLSLDVRDIDLGRRDGVLAAIYAACDAIAARREVAVERTLINADAPATCDVRLAALIAEACAEERATSRPMVSRAYHDALFMARITPVAMIFIPCRGGVSHRPDEYAKPEDIGCGVAVLARSLAALSS